LDPRGRTKGWIAKGPLHLTLWHPGDGSGRVGRRLILPSVGEGLLCEAIGVVIRAKSAYLIVRCPGLERSAGRRLHATLSVRGVGAEDSMSPKSGALLEYWPLGVEFTSIVAEGGKKTSQRAAALSQVSPGGWADWSGWPEADDWAWEDSLVQARDDGDVRSVAEPRDETDLRDEIAWPLSRNSVLEALIEVFIGKAVAYVRSVVAKTGLSDLASLQEHLRGDQSWSGLCLSPLRKLGSRDVVIKGGKKVNAYFLRGLQAVDRHGRHGARVLLSALFLRGLESVDRHGRHSARARLAPWSFEDAKDSSDWTRSRLGDGSIPVDGETLDRGARTDAIVPGATALG